MKPILLYTNYLVDIIHIPLEAGGHTKQFYIVEKNTNNTAYFINGFKTVKEFKDSIVLLEKIKKDYKDDKEYLQVLKQSLKVYNSIKTNWANTKFLPNVN